VRTLRISRRADEDIVAALELSLRRFGGSASRRYEALIVEALNGLCAEPARIGSAPHPELGPGIRAYHLRFSREDARTAEGVVQRPRHIVVYRELDKGVLEVLRVLHDRMAPERHVLMQADLEIPEDPSTGTDV
jgi:toxin ParE1/3/4